MRNLLIFLLLFSTTLAVAQTNLSNNLQLNAPKSLDNRTGIFQSGIWRAYNSTSEANSTISPFYRYKGMTVQVNVGGIPTDYWYRDSILDASLVQKTFNYVIPNLDQVLTAGNTTNQTIVSGNIIPASDTLRSLGNKLLRYNNGYFNHIHIHDTITDLNPFYADYGFTMTGKGHTTNAFTFNDSATKHSLTIRESPVIAGVQFYAGEFHFGSSDASVFWNQADKPMTVALNDLLLIGGQSASGTYVSRNNTGDTTKIDYNSNAYRGGYYRQFKIGGSPSFNGDVNTPSNMALDVSGLTGAKVQGVRLSPITTTQRNLITSPENGLLIYNTTKGVYEYYDGVAWRVVGSVLVSPNGSRWEQTIDNSGNTTFTPL